jgi:ankyrin repeat protein
LANGADPSIPKESPVLSLAIGLASAKRTNRRPPFVSFAVVELLVDAGADVNAINRAGETPLHFAASCDTPDFTALLLARGADASARTRRTNRSPLDEARAYKHPEIEKLLLEAERKK